MSNVLDTITRLKALARNAGTQAEAEAAANAAERLISKYQLDEVVLNGQLWGSGTAREELTEAEQPLWEGKSTKVWLTMLANGLCIDHGCALICQRVRGESVTFRFAGNKTDMELVRYLFAWLSVEIDRLARRERGAAAINAFRVGATVGVLRAMKGARQQEVAETSRQSAQMVLVDRAAQAMTYLVAKAGGRVKKGSGPSLHDRSAYERGKTAGANMTTRHGLVAGHGHLALGPGRN